MSNQSIADRYSAAVIGNYGKMPVALVRGAGSRLWDADGKEYIDLFAGFGGTILGHAHPALIAAITKQAETLWCVGNQFYNEPQARLGEQLSKHGFEGRAFFCHSGAEANEAAIKLARLSAGEGRNKIISCLKGFHGRTMGALSATPGPYQNGFGPMVPGHVFVPYDDLAALKAAVDSETAGIILEPIQGEGGINIPSDDYIVAVRKLCDEKNITLIFDEVWTGVGRTGRFFGHQHFLNGKGVTPDIMSMGKALGGGIPVAGILAKPEKAAFFKPGTHGCTLGGNPVCAAVAATIFDVIEKDGLLAHATQLGEKAQAAIRNFKHAGSRIKDVRGKGLFIGIELDMADASKLPLICLERGLSMNVTRKNVIRVCPAITIDENLLMKGLEILDQAIAAL